MVISVLIIDDEPQILNVYEKVFDILDGKQFYVHKASTAEEATQILIREDINLVLLDLRLPDIDGRRVYEVIREYAPDVPIMITSVYPVSTQKKILPHADEYFDKSEGPYQLLHKLADFLESQKT